MSEVTRSVKISRRRNGHPVVREEHKLGYSTKTAMLLLTPSGLILGALVVVPLIFLVFTSFTDFNQRTLFTGEFNVVGLSTYAAVLADSEFWWSVVRTVLLMAACVAGTVLLGMAVAQFMTKLGKVTQYIVTVTMILAWAMPEVASAEVWNWLFQPGYGVINWLLTQLHVFGDVTNVSWANDARLAYICIWLLVVWQAIPFVAVTMFAAIQQVDPSCIEAAKIDGAGPVRLYWMITIPLVKPTLLLVTVLSIIWDFNIFNQIWLVSKGGPDNATANLGVFTYKKAFVGFDIGNGAAISVITTLMLLALTAVYIRSLLKSGEDLV
ncbi:carbohydrate ABC transporter permease [Bifidobacterium felsineum]|uniref:ABC transporter permease n=1 Tax=Bifidobacterium felsineum TaxID=2045440 RepID=A0A2M9HL74_9BIFI|nr:sugar ABC transporter permease [Bifidobacterium felsineum]PJM77576.1 ABC transporter permease [Bifidobacterium felsineum]